MRRISRIFNASSRYYAFIIFLRGGGTTMEHTIKSIETALENEIRERDFYLHQSQKTADPVGSQMFARIAEDEQEHYHRLKALHDELSRHGKWPESIPVPLKDTTIKESLKNIVSNADAEAIANADDREAVRIAINFETKGYHFYSRLKERAESRVVRDFFDRLASIEYEHLTSLKETLLFLEDPATWYEQQEKPHFEG